MVAWLFINTIGGLIISALTLVAATYLLVSLWNQGKGKLRVRLLMGMVISDLLLGVGALVPEALYLAKKPLQEGTHGCDAHGFIFTAILFSQHLWTLSIAIATFLLLKHPLSRATTLMERYSWAAGPSIWIISFLHSGIWWACVGWTNTSALCYYGSSPMVNGLDARDLIQFIPRALVFIVIVGLYSTLFSFLRRPDTIQLSSQFMSGEVSRSDPAEGPNGTHLSRMMKKLGRNQTKKTEAINPEAPWEQMEFVQVGHGRNFGMTSVTSTPEVEYNNWNYKASSPSTARPSLPNNVTFNPLASIDNGLDDDIAQDQARSFSAKPSTDHLVQKSSSSTYTDLYPSEASDSPKTPISNSQRPSETETYIDGGQHNLLYGASTPSSEDTATYSNDKSTKKKELSPILSHGSMFTSSLHYEGEMESRRASMSPSVVRDSARIKGTGDAESISSSDSGRPPGQALRELFQANQAFPNPDDEVGGGTSGWHKPGGGRGGLSGLSGAMGTSGNGKSAGAPMMSATAYFNRQASLLMLYFPLAYMAVFSISLVRLIYAMVTAKPSPVLALMSAWSILAVGLIDGLVYGIAELLVRRRVRRKMPDRMG